MCDRWLAELLDEVVPLVMRCAGLDAWVLIAREYNEDPVLRTMLPATWVWARRRTVLVFTDGGEKRCAVARYPIGSHFVPAWDLDAEPDQWQALTSVLQAADPGTIGVSTSKDFAVGDGLMVTESDALHSALHEALSARVVSAETAATGWLETRIPGEVEAYDQICRSRIGSCVGVCP